VRLVLGGGEIVRPGITYELQRGAGMWVAFVAAALAFAGAWLNHRSGATRSEAPPPSAHRLRSG
jgi:hypothetical protein